MRRREFLRLAAAAFVPQPPIYLPMIMSNPTLSDILTGAYPVASGTTVRLHEDEYTLPASVSAPGLIVRSAPGHRARLIIPGGQTTEITGAGLVLIGVEITGTWPDGRVAALNPPSDLRLPGLTIYGAGVQLRRCYIHDTAGPFSGADAAGAVFADCLSHNNGWLGPDRGHGHAWYLQNAAPAWQWVERCALMRGYSDYSMHMYTQGGRIEGLACRDCVGSGATWLVGGYQPADQIWIDGLSQHGGGVALAYNDDPNGIARVQGLRRSGGATLTPGYWENLSVAEMPTPIDEVRVLGSPGWQTVVVHNAAGAESIAAPVGGVYRNALNWAETIQLETGDNLPLTGWTVATPTGASDPLYDHPGPAFNCFIVEL